MPHASAYETVLILSIYIRAAARETATRKLDDTVCHYCHGKCMTEINICIS